jgi:serine/threonine protein kinase
VGSGASCTVYLFIDLVEHKAGAFKKPRKKDPNAEFALRQEFDILQELNAGGAIWGIQQRPIECLTICRKSQKTSEYKQRRGVLHPLYQGSKSDGIGCDYVNHLNTRDTDPFDITLLRIHQLLHALQFLHEKNYLQGDVKLENILLEKLWTHLTDFGTAVTPTMNLKEFFSGKMSVRPKVTASNSSKQDLLDSDRCMKIGQLDELRAIEKSREVFAMGVVFATALKGAYPFQQDSHEFAVPHTYEGAHDLEPEINVLVKDMCNFNRALRLDALSAYERLHLYIKTNKPLLYDQIKKLIREGGYVAPRLE